MVASLLAEPAPTSPGALAARRAGLLTAKRLDGLREAYDVVVVGSGLAGLTAANVLARQGRSVLLLEQHYNLGGLATWFKRPGGHIFDVSLHGFPVGMKKTCRKYWGPELSDAIIPLRSVRFDNPQFRLDTTFDRSDFIRILQDKFGASAERVRAFFERLEAMNFYDDQSQSTRALFQEFFPGRKDIWRLLMEPIAYANGSSLDDPAISYGIVFSNFMKKGVYTFRGGTDQMIATMKMILRKNGVDIRNYAQVERIATKPHSTDARHAVTGVRVNGRSIRARAVVSNANLRTTVCRMLAEDAIDAHFRDEVSAVRMNPSSSQVYFGVRKGERIPFVGELLFTSTAPEFDSDALTAMDCTSRTFSFYYPKLRPGSDRYAIVASINSRYADWKDLSDEAYRDAKETLAEDSLAVLERYLPGVRRKIDHIEVATPRTFAFYTQHAEATSFGTKFEGLKYSRALPEHVGGLFHAGSVGIIMSGWLGAANYGVIVANEVDRFLGAKGV